MNGLQARIRVAAMLCGMAVVGPVPSLEAQAPPPPIAIEFEVDANDPRVLTRYRLDFFRQGSDLKGGPVLRVEPAEVTSASDGRITVDVRRATRLLPNGKYVVTVTTVRDGVASARSAPSSAFSIEGSSVAQPRAGQPHPPPESPDPSITKPGAPPTAATPDEAQEERGGVKTFFVILAAVMGSLLLLPMVMH